MAVAAPAAAAVGRQVAGKAAQSAAGKGASSAAGKGAQAAGKGAGGAGGASGGGGKAAAAAGGAPQPKKGKGLEAPDVPDRKGARKEKKKGASWGKKALTQGSSAKYRKMLVAEFLVCVLLLGLSPLAKPSGELGPVRFMKRGTATCAFFIILGILSSFGTGSAKAAAAFGGLVTLVLAVDQREAFGKTAQLLNAKDDDDKADTTGAGAGPSDDTDAPDTPDVVET